MCLRYMYTTKGHYMTPPCTCKVSSQFDIRLDLNTDNSKEKSYETCNFEMIKFTFHCNEALNV